MSCQAINSRYQPVPSTDEDDPEPEPGPGEAGDAAEQPTLDDVSASHMIGVSALGKITSKSRELNVVLEKVVPQTKTDFENKYGSSLKLQLFWKNVVL